MDNITFKKIWKDNGFAKFKVTANSEFITVSQSCYIDYEYDIE